MSQDKHQNNDNKNSDNNEQNAQIQIELKEDWTNEDEQMYQRKGSRRIAHIPKQSTKTVSDAIILPFHQDDESVKEAENSLVQEKEQESSNKITEAVDSVKSNRPISLFKQERMLKNLDINKK